VKPSDRWTSTEKLALTVLFSLTLLTLANIFFNFVMWSRGADHPYTYYLVPWSDLFADYFKFILSYPGGRDVPISNLGGLGNLLNGYIIDNPYQGVEGLNHQGLTHLHVTPLSTLYSLLNVRAMRWIDPVILFAGQIFAGSYYGWMMTCRGTVRRREALIWFIIGLISYPTVTMLTRGNLFAGMAALMLIDALMRAMRGQSIVAGAILLSIAINIRPNAVIFVLPFLIFCDRRWAIALLWITFSTIALAVTSFLGAHAFYADYSIANFLAGLKNYYYVYVVGGDGLAYGSSLFGGLGLMFGNRSRLDELAASGALIPYLALILMFLRGRIDRAILLFATCCTYTLASTIFADYHLMAFLMVIPMIVISQRHDKICPKTWPTDHLIAVIATILILSPKNYFFSGIISWQSALNPAILLLAQIGIIMLNLRPAKIPNGAMLWTARHYLPDVSSKGRKLPIVGKLSG
jgi:hypothetical protein